MNNNDLEILIRGLNRRAVTQAEMYDETDVTQCATVSLVLGNISGALQDVLDDRKSISHSK